MMPYANQPLAVDIAANEVALALADALERLGIRISRDLDVEAGEGALPEDPAWAATLIDFVAYAEQCLEILDRPDVATFLARAESMAQPEDAQYPGVSPRHCS